MRVSSGKGLMRKGPISTAPTHYTLVDADEQCSFSWLITSICDVQASRRCQWLWATQHMDVGLACALHSMSYSQLSTTRPSLVLPSGEDMTEVPANTRGRHRPLIQREFGMIHEASGYPHRCSGATSAWDPPGLNVHRMV